MSDEADRASEREEAFRVGALAAQARRSSHVGESAEDCAVCDEPIPEARRRALPGVQTCIECQAALEFSTRVKR
ncbi:MAG: TraR/DksA C4-type zinc finger protein [Azonexus sp.]|jgi:phage/conjugal plasmid C-4 type zinc finger TraR family protein|nr:TraR/DksA C4-type zinc finger protein [Azonexus sp.]